MVGWLILATSVAIYVRFHMIFAAEQQAIRMTSALASRVIQTGDLENWEREWWYYGNRASFAWMMIDVRAWSVRGWFPELRERYYSKIGPPDRLDARQADGRG